MSYTNDARGGGGESRQRVLIVCQRGQVLSMSECYGALRASLEIARQFINKGMNVTVAGLSEQREGVVAGIPFVGAGTDEDLAFLLAGWSPVDILIAISRADALLWVKARKYCIYQHNPVPVEGGLPAWWFDWTSTPIVCVSQYSKSQHVRAGISSRLLSVVNNGCDICACDTQVASRIRSHKLLFVGHPVHYKGLDIALQAYRILRERFKDVTLDVYGDCPNDWRGKDHFLEQGCLTSDGALNWSAITDDLHGVVFHGGVSFDEIVRQYSSHDMLLMPSRMENFPLVSLEAQSCGCIPVVANTGGMPETIQNGVTGFVYLENTPQSLAQMVISIWNSGGIDDVSRVAAQRWVADNLTWSSACDGFVTVLAQIKSKGQVYYIYMHLLYSIAMILKRLCAFLVYHIPGMWRVQMLRGNIY